MSTIYKGQIMGGTRLDRQGERIPKAQLERIVEKTRGKRSLLHAHHDMSKPPTGYYENVRLVQDPDTPSEWNLVADITVETGSLTEAIGGFSISYLELKYEGTDPICGHIYLPYPLYNDDAIVKAASNEMRNGVGKWVKKGDAIAIVALILGVLYFVLKPVWDQAYAELYKDKVGKLIDHFKNTRKLLQEKGVGTELVLIMKSDEAQIEIRFMPDQSDVESGLKTDAIMEGLRTAHAYIASTPITAGRSLDRLVMRFDSSAGSYVLDRPDYAPSNIKLDPPPK
jgi:hypothetical protein